MFRQSSVTRSGNRRMADPMDSVADYYTPLKGQSTALQNYRTISLINYPSKVMLKVILSRLNPLAEEIIAEDQAGFTAVRNTTEQIFSSEFFVKSTCHINRIRTMSSQIKKTYLTGIACSRMDSHTDMQISIQL